MKILNQELIEKLRNAESVMLDLGCGQCPRQGFYGVDNIDLPGVHVVANLNDTFELFPSNSVNYIYSRHAFEHVENIIGLMNEVYRIVTPDGKIEIIVPHFSNIFGYSDPTHVRLFGLYSMHYFVPSEFQAGSRKVPSFYSNAKFKIESIKIDFYKISLIDYIVAPLISRIINLNLAMQLFYERRLSGFYHAAQIKYTLTPIK